MEKHFDNKIIFNIRDFVNGSPKYNYLHVINDIKNLPRFYSFRDNKLIFIKDQINQQSYILNNLQTITKIIFYDDILYKKAFNIANKNKKNCLKCKKEIFLFPERQHKLLLNLNFLISEFWYEKNVNKKCCQLVF